MSANVPEIFSRRPFIAEMEMMPNPEAFSTPCPAVLKNMTFGNTELEVVLIERGTKNFCLKTLPLQFHDSACMAREAFKEMHGNPDVQMKTYMRQGGLKPNTNFTGSEIHIDLPVRRYPYNNDTALENFVVSDCLPTIFYDQTFELPDFQQWEHGQTNRMLTKFFHEQAKPEARVCAKPYHPMRVGPYTAHQAQKGSAESKFRTFMIIRFD